MRRTAVYVYFEPNCRSLECQNLRIEKEFRGHLVKSALEFLLASEDSVLIKVTEKKNMQSFTQLMPNTTLELARLRTQ